MVQLEIFCFTVSQSLCWGSIIITGGDGLAETKTRKLSEKEMPLRLKDLQKTPVISYLKTEPCHKGMALGFFEFETNFMIRVE